MSTSLSIPHSGMFNGNFKSQHPPLAFKDHHILDLIQFSNNLSVAFLEEFCKAAQVILSCSQRLHVHVQAHLLFPICLSISTFPSLYGASPPSKRSLQYFQLQTVITLTGSSQAFHCILRTRFNHPQRF